MILSTLISEKRGTDLSIFSDNNLDYYCAAEIYFSETTVKLNRTHNKNHVFGGIEIYGVKK